MKNILKHTLSLVMTLAISYSIQAQGRYFDERYIYTQANLNPQLINPGAFGYLGGHNVVLNYRNNWAGIDGSPKSVTLHYNGDVGNGLSFGAGFLSDRFASLSTTKGLAGINYRINGDVNRIGFGITGEFISHSLTDIGNANPSDPFIVSGLAGTEYFDASIGMYGLYMDKFSYGIAFPSIVSTSITELQGEVPEREIGFIVQAGYEMQLQQDIKLRPSIIMKKLNNVPTHMDAYLNLEFLEGKLIGGMNYTFGADKRLGFQIGTKLEKLNLFYSYNTTSHSIQQYNNGAHELTLGIAFGGKSTNQ
jgi:type IX secretion system PorP/SprF family membrane protein